MVGILWMFITAGPLAGQTPGPPSGGIPPEDRFIYHPLPDALIHTRRGDYYLSQLWQETPLLFTMVYTRCRGVCYPFTHSLKSVIPQVGGLGKDYRIVVISFDPNDTVESMENMATITGVQEDENWIFGVASAEDIHRLAESVGYWARYDSTRQQFDHPAVLIGVQRGGVIVRFLVGATVVPGRLYEVIRELRGEFIPAYPLPRKNVIFSCFQYDPTRGIVIDWGFLLLLLPGVVTIGGT
ncbi:MAG: hypothetical protein D6681_01730, partial [Calditrichaeota bacterium]